jgi:hypothetical protein
MAGIQIDENDAGVSRGCLPLGDKTSGSA